MQTHSLHSLRDHFAPTQRMPVVFLGHGSPMHAITEGPFSQAWATLGQGLPRPNAILVVSAHWMTRGTTLVDVSALPRTIHDFNGFPDALYAEQYPAEGHPDLAREVVSLLASHRAEEDDTWGLDHGAWAVLKYLYPEADVPAFQVSIDMGQGLAHQLEIGQALSDLRDRGVLILGSGNIVHNLRRLSFDGKPEAFALEFDDLVTGRLIERDFDTMANREKLGSLLSEAHPSVDHYLPALTIAGASDQRNDLLFMTDSIDLGSISMRSFIFHQK